LHVTRLLDTALRRSWPSSPPVPFRSLHSRSASFSTASWSVALTFLMMFVVGALRGLVTIERWWMAGLEMLLLGIAVALAAYGSGIVVAALVRDA